MVETDGVAANFVIVNYRSVSSSVSALTSRVAFSVLQDTSTAITDSDSGTWFSEVDAVKYSYYVYDPYGVLTYSGMITTDSMATIESNIRSALGDSAAPTLLPVPAPTPEPSVTFGPTTATFSPTSPPTPAPSLLRHPTVPPSGGSGGGGGGEGGASMVVVSVIVGLAALLLLGGVYFTFSRSRRARSSGKTAKEVNREGGGASNAPLPVATAVDVSNQ